MKRAVRLFGALVATALSWAAFAPARSVSAVSLPKDALYVPGEVVVVFRSRGRLTSPLAQARTLARRAGARVSRVSGRNGSAVIKAIPGADVKELARRFASDAGVRFAEPNYIYRVTGEAAGVAPTAYVVRRAAGATRKLAVPKATLSAMKTRSSAGIKATYPTDKLIWDNAGWDWVNASIVWNNTTPSKNVCVIDTGVDYNHKDLTTSRVIKGWDCVNEDSDPMDDNGHGTHVAGIIAAKQNNTEGIAGVSPTAKVVAVKAFNADGWGTSWDIAQAIRYCADRSDVSIINMSFGGPYSGLQELAVDQATNVKGKLLVASAGNESSDTPYCSDETTSADKLKSGIRSYPAGFAIASSKYDWDGENCVDTGDPLHVDYPAVLSVGAGGAGSEPDYACRAESSNYGEWVNVTGPGTSILSTTPWDKPFTLNVDEGVAPRYDFLSGTSTAAAFVSGVAARAWGYKSTFTNMELAGYVKDTGYEIPVEDGDAEEVCWPTSMNGVTDVNVAAALDRGGLVAEAFDAVTGLPLIGATIKAYQGSEKASAVLEAQTFTSPDFPAGYLFFPSSVDLINLPASVTTTLKVNKSGYTSSAINAFMGAEFLAGNPDGTIEAPWGGWLYAGYAAVPPKSARFTAVSAWDRWEDRASPVLTTALPDRMDKVSGTPDYDGQMFNFVVGYDVCDEKDELPGLEGNTIGELSVFPNAQAVYQNWVDTHQVLQRSGASSLPQWTGEYVFRVYNPDLDFDSRQGSLFIWKDGSLKKRVDMTGTGCDVPGSFNDWWEAAAISSGKSGSVTIEAINECKDRSSIDSSARPFPVNCP
jgi:subtilisin family serine protease